MFWANKDGSTEKQVELRKKNLFVARFTNTATDKWQGTPKEKELSLLVKKIDAPSINLNFERAYASSFVHYFQQGEIFWEPITITFVDVIDRFGNEETGEIPKWRTIFFNYFNNSPIRKDNRTGVLDSPIFCRQITIENYSSLYKDKGEEQEQLNFDSVTDKFVIYNPRITKISFGSFDYSSDDANEITVTFVPEWCDLGT
jgi:hypothetical protein